MMITMAQTKAKAKIKEYLKHISLNIKKIYTMEQRE